MRLDFDECGKNFVEIRENKETGTIFISLSSQDSEDLLKTIVNSVEITKEQFRELISGIEL